MLNGYFFNHSLVDGHLDYLHFLAILKKSQKEKDCYSKNSIANLCLDICSCSSWRMCRNQIAGLYDQFMFNL